ncbi:hypothetical protein BC829DRAFT_403644 [Chytridium lagenaria]|nr:hypothetical protein BC829DRAFT_403644 [Chytridium lagenaria]
MEEKERLDTEPKPLPPKIKPVPTEPAPIVAPPKSVSMTDWNDLKDWASMFLAVMCFRKNAFEETLRLLDKTSNYQLVLNKGRFAFFTLIKAKSLVKLGQVEEAIKALMRRQSQEDALYNLMLESPEALNTSQRDLERLSLEDFRKSNLSVFSPKAPPIPFAIAPLLFKLVMTFICFFYISFIVRKSRSSFIRKFKGEDRIKPWREFVKRVKVDEVGKALVESWTANPQEISKRM